MARRKKCDMHGGRAIGFVFLDAREMAANVELPNLPLLVLVQ